MKPILFQYVFSPQDIGAFLYSKTAHPIKKFRIFQKFVKKKTTIIVAFLFLFTLTIKPRYCFLFSHSSRQAQLPQPEQPFFFCL